MDHKEILERAIEKAIDGGWNKNLNIDPAVSTHIHAKHSKELIFNHDFAKALWGQRLERMIACEKCNFPSNRGIDEPYNSRFEFCPIDGSKLGEVEVMIGVQPWIRHLQQMVIAGDPIKYLGENL